MDLREYYYNNVTTDDYHFKFLKMIENGDLVEDFMMGTYRMEGCSFDVFDLDDAIEKFRELCDPNTIFDNENTCWFYIILFYLYKLGYVVEEFPHLVDRPPAQPDDFATKAIRKRLIEEGRVSDIGVPYDERRKYVASLKFVQKNFYVTINDQIEEKFKLISTRNAEFDNMAQDEKLKEIINLIEFLLMKDGKVLDLDYDSICFGYISSDDIKRYRKQMQCFRHARRESILEREGYTNLQKNFFIDYGLTIIKIISILLNGTQN